jgi:hypothetical protein
LENNKIENINLEGNSSKIIKENNITLIGCLNLKESILKNKSLKKIRFDSFSSYKNEIKLIDNEFLFVYKLIMISENELDLRFSKNIYFSSPFVRLNYLKCFIDHFDNLFFNFHHFDIIILFQ